MAGEVVSLYGQGLEIERVEWDSLTPHPDNPRLGNPDLIIESIRANGVYRPVVVAQDGTILAGHHLWYALGELGRPMVDVVRLPISATSATATRIMLVDNRSTDQSRYENVALAALLQTLDDDLIGTGYTPEALDDLLALLDEQNLQPLVMDGNVDRLPSLTDKMQKYQEMGRRMVVLDYSQEEYPRITQQLGRLRSRFGVPSNAQAVQALLDQEVEV